MFLNDVLINEFSSIYEASVFYNIYGQNLGDNLHGRSKKCHGYVFKFK